MGAGIGARAAAVTAARIVMGQVVTKAARQALAQTLRLAARAALQQAIQAIRAASPSVTRFTTQFVENMTATIIQQLVMSQTGKDLAGYAAAVKTDTDGLMRMLDKCFGDRLTGVANMHVMGPTVVSAGGVDVLPHQNVQLMWRALNSSSNYTDELWDDFYSNAGFVTKAAFWTAEFAVGLGQKWIDGYRGRMEAKVRQIEAEASKLGREMRAQNKRQLEALARAAVGGD